MLFKSTHYETLEVSTKATDVEITAAYRKMAMKWHPDRHLNDAKVQAENRFKEIQFAYAVLSDAIKKTAYDKSKNINQKQINDNDGNLNTGKFEKNLHSQSKKQSSNNNSYRQEHTPNKKGKML